LPQTDSDVLYAQELYAQELEAIPRNGASPVSTVQDFFDRLDSATLCVAELRECYRSEGREDWWHMADLLDNLSDLRSALHGDIRNGVIRRSAVCKLMLLLDPLVPSISGVIEVKITESVHLKTLQNLPLCGAPDIVSATLFKSRMEGAVFVVADLLRCYERDQRIDCNRMAKLLDNLVALLDSIRSSPRHGTLALFSVVDLPFSA
jgi:hypothetical protein